MNLLYVLNEFPKLSETFILNEISELTKRGIDIEILALRNPLEVTINEDVLENQLFDRTKYFWLPQPTELRFQYAFSPIFYNCMLKSLKYYYPVSSVKHILRLSYYTPFYRNIDLVHAHFAHNAAYTGMQISRVLNKPFTFTAHAFEIFGRQSYSKDRLKILTEGAEKIITPSVFNKRYIINETGCTEDKIEIVRATINPGKFNEQKRLHNDERRIKVVAIGRLVEKKGFEYLIKAMSKIVEKEPTTFLSIVGSGELENDLINLTRNLGLTKSVNFLGAQTNERVLYELSSSDLAVLPCVVAEDGDMDVCPLTLQEAMAMGIPVVSTTIGSIPELITDGEEGLLVAERNESALADAILKLVHDPALRENLGKKGREKILKEFNIKTQVDKLLEIWKKIVDHNMENTNSELLNER